MKKFKQRSLTIPQQNLGILKYYPSFNYKRNGTWTGTLHPSLDSHIYTIKIVYSKYRPRVYVIEPKINDHAPHRYPDGSLCLYYPNDISHHNGLFLTDTIIPWTSEWLYYYEKWLVDEVWWGPEAPHSPKKE